MPRKITYSMLSTWLSCRQKFDYRYNRCIVARENMTALSFGSAVHAGLESWFNMHDAVLAREMSTRSDLSDVDNAKAQALVAAYCENYVFEAFDVVKVEYEFDTPIVNPRTGYRSRTWTFGGKVDGLVSQNGELFILEHKTSSRADDGYLDRIEIDMQITLYAIAIRQALEIPVVGAIYDILEKPGIRLKTNETIEEFRERLAESVTEESFIRRTVRFSDEFLTSRQEMLWEMCREIAHGTICPNTGACLQYGTCAYLPLCRAHGNVEHCPDLYTTRRPHEELSNG